MKTTKRIISILLTCLMLVGMLSVGVFADTTGTKDNPINANEKWFGNGLDCFLLNTTLSAGDTDGVWYALTANANGIVQLENKYKEEGFAYQIYAWANGKGYVCCENGIYNMPMMTLPVSAGDVITIQVIAQDTSVGGTVYLNAKIVTGENDSTQTIKVKSAPAKLYVAAGATVYFQDDSLQAEYAAQYVNITGDSVENVVVYNVFNNATSGTSSQAPYTDSNNNGVIELKLGGQPASMGTPAVKPAWAIENNSNEDRCFTINVVDSTAHDCHWDDDADTDCNTCKTIRDVASACKHVYDDLADADCNTCGQSREVVGISDGGSAACADVRGLAMRFIIPVEGMKMDGTTAIFDNATIGGYKLVSMGAKVWQDKMPDYVVDIPVKYLYSLDEENGIASFAIRIIDIPENHEDTPIYYRSYFIYEDETGKQHVIYGSDVYATYR